MSNNPNNNPIQDDEFDIEVMASKLWRLQKKVWYKLFFPARVILAKPRQLIITLVLGLLLAFIGRYTIPPIYQTSIIIKPANLTEYTYLGMLADLRLLLKDDNYEELSRKLNLTIEQCKSLKDIETNVIYRNPLRKDTISSVEIFIYSKDAYLIDTLQYRLLNNYLNGSAYYQKIYATNMEELNALEDRLLNDLRENDSLKKVVTANAFPRGGGGFVYGEPLDPLKIYESGLDLYEQLIILKGRKKFTENFELVKPGIVRLKPYFPRLIWLIPSFLLLALLTCFSLNIRSFRS